MKLMMLCKKYAGAFFGPEMKYAGNNKMTFRSKSENLVYLYINDDKIELYDATHLQEKGALEALTARSF
jgi:aldehyde:ferredoxin oxidoreductase